MLFRSNVEYFVAAKDALFAGFRPCARCRPLDGEKAEAPVWIRTLVDKVEADPKRRVTDAEIRTDGIDPAAVRRWFLRSYGMTFQAYCRARRLGAAFRSIRDGGNLDDAVFDSGWESHSAFRDAFSKIVGLPPGAARETDFVRLAWIETDRKSVV